jgi:hypothetical protein
MNCPETKCEDVFEYASRASMISFNQDLTIVSHASKEAQLFKTNMTNVENPFYDELQAIIMSKIHVDERNRDLKRVSH